MHFAHLVLDAAPLINGTVPATIADAFYTVPEVMAEIKDASTRERILQGSAAYSIQLMSPSAEALQIVASFAKATGDYAVLSGTDLRVIALAVTLELKHNGEKSKLRRSPITAMVHNSSSTPSSSTSSSTSSTSTSSSSTPSPKPSKNISTEAATIQETLEDEGEWITPENIHKNGIDTRGGWKREGNDSQAKSPSPALTKIACITSDFAMQNVLLQMRLLLYTPDGVRVRRVKNWLLRCHACYTTTKEMSRKFCPQCGGATLLRTSYSVDAFGQVHLYLRSDFQYNLRGTQYSIPMPKGGRNNGDLILREDQVEYQRALRNWQRVERKAERASSDLDAIDGRLSAIFGDLSVVGGGGSGSISKKPGSHQNASPPVIGYGRRNPNQVRRTNNK